MSKEPVVFQRKKYSVQQILDYMDCSLCYHLKYIKKVPPSATYLADNKNLAYQEAMHETIRFYYLEHQNNKPPPLKSLYDKFYTLWLAKTGTERNLSILTRSIEESGRHAREERSRYVTKGYESLRKFYGQNANKKQAVLAVHHPYEIQLKDLTVVGNFDLIREVMNEKTKRREIEIVSFQLSNRKPDESRIQHDFNLSAMAFGFQETFGAVPDRFILDYISRGETYPVFRHIEEYKRMLATLEAFRQSVDTIPPFPKPGGHGAISPYKELCDNYRF